MLYAESPLQCIPPKDSCRKTQFCPSLCSLPFPSTSPGTGTGVWHTWCVTHLMCDTPDVWHPCQPLLHHLTQWGIGFILTAGQVTHKYYTKRNKLTFVQRPLYLYSFREWNECQMFHCNIFILSTTENTSKTRSGCFTSYYKGIKSHLADLWSLEPSTY